VKPASAISRFVIFVRAVRGLADEHESGRGRPLDQGVVV